ncbi:hypothetical protein VTK26DRAFT_3001 [Humicola hyalothermophila]
MAHLAPSLLLALLSGASAAPPPPLPTFPSDLSLSSLSFSTLAVDPPAALPQNATASDLRYQPALDFDRDGCYNVPAIGPDGAIAEGLPHHFTGLASDCRDESDLDNNNVYSRQRCNSGWCVYLYGYYFEKDVATANFIDTGHTHDWEHIAVWVRQEDGRPAYVAASQHGQYEVRPAEDVRWEEGLLGGGGMHPKMVYHKDGLSTHCFRFANAADEQIENHKGVWFRGALVSYNGFPSTELRESLFAHDFGAGNIGFMDANFAGSLTRAKPAEVVFDVNLDEGSPGTP